jgi:hypothetical protein
MGSEPHSPPIARLESDGRSVDVNFAEGGFLVGSEVGPIERLAAWDRAGRLEWSSEAVLLSVLGSAIPAKQGAGMAPAPRAVPGAAPSGRRALLFVVAFVVALIGAFVPNGLREMQAPRAFRSALSA